MPPFRRYLKGNNTKTGLHGPRRKAFHSNRLTEPDLATENGDLEQQPESAEESLDESLEDSSEEDEIPASAVNPYNALLKSLNSRRESEQHPRKRRRLDAFVNPEPIPDTNGNHPKSHEGLEEVIDDAADMVEENEDAEESENDDDLEAGFESEDDLPDSMLAHLDIDDDRLKTMIQESKGKPSPPARLHFHTGLKAVVSGQSSHTIGQIEQRKKSSKMSLDSLNIKQKLLQRTRKLFPNGFDSLTNSLISPIFSLQDVLFCDRTVSNGERIQKMICVHILDYVLKTRDRVLKNTAKLAKADSSDSQEYRDQGFTRPKVLVLLPTRQACYRLVDFLVSLYEPEQQENRKRFNDSFSRKDDDISQDKPADFRDLFGGNDDDLFRIGIKFTRKSVKFFSQFYSSDIILASPLGLRMAMEKKDSKKEDFDFLSSIELLIVDQADALLQQNWEHVEYIFNHLNLQPKENHGCDFSRVRNWYLDGNARYLRQTIVLSAYLTPELNQIYGRHMLNIEGSLKISAEAFQGAIVSLGIAIKQTFVRFEAGLPQNEPDARFKAFATTILPSLVKTVKSGVQSSHGILIFIPSYMDFVRIRNYMANSTAAQDISFGTISEYTRSSDVARARSHFASGRHSILLYSGRAHHFRRYKLKGVKKVVIYALPDNPVFYVEVAGTYLARSVSEGMVNPEDAHVRSLFCKWDVLKIERVVGSKRVPSMLKERGGEIFDFI